MPVSDKIVDNRKLVQPAAGRTSVSNPQGEAFSAGRWTLVQPTSDILKMLRQGVLVEQTNEHRAALQKKRQPVAPSEASAGTTEPKPSTPKASAKAAK